ncbi:MAG: hypothetical protein L3J49_06195, partial [Desulfobulbaceae bacterium]|nr:hypothetical protein [Desulfobulbaceae bacterium]
RPAGDNYASGRLCCYQSPAGRAPTWYNYLICYYINLTLTAMPGGVELLTYKRDRSITLVCMENNRYRVLERGFEDREIFVDSAHASLVLKILIKREFPRSRKVRLIRFSSPQELQRSRQRINT